MIRYLGKKGIQVLDAGDDGLLESPLVVAPSTVIPRRMSSIVLITSTNAYIPWRQAELAYREIVRMNGGTIQEPSLEESVIEIPTGSVITHINIHVQLSVGLSPGATANIRLQKNGAQLINNSMKSNIYIGNFSQGSQYPPPITIREDNIPVSPGDVIQLYALVQNGSLYVLESSDSSLGGGNGSYCMVEEIV